MTLSRDSIFALQRHFLGALSAPSHTWLEPLPSQPLVFIGDALRAHSDGSAVDFGSVSSPGEERRLVRVCNRGAEQADVRLDEPPAWLIATWLERDGDTASLASGESAMLELIVPHDAEREFRGTLRFHIADRIEELGVQMTARRWHPVAQFDFNGSPVPTVFDFGVDDRPYALSVANATSIPLVVTFSDLPDWLTFEVHGQSRGGPIEGAFFERAAPFVVQIRPRNLGMHRGVLRVSTNDPRPELQTIELHFAACVVATTACVRVTRRPARVRMRADQTITIAAHLENLGRVPARTVKEKVPGALSVREAPVIPAAHDGQPGSATVPIRVAPRNLSPGVHALTLTLRIEDGDPPTVDVPVQIDVVPARRSVLRPEAIAALFALLLLTLLLVIVRGMS
jgi:hypothetical protein